MEDAKDRQGFPIPTPSPGQGEDWRSLAAAISCISIVGMMLGITIPLLAVIMERDMGESSTMIGASASMHAIATLAVTPFFARIVVSVGTMRLLMGSLMATFASLVLLKIFENIWAWMPIRLMLGVALTFLFIISETWINHVARNENRGKIMGLYAASLSGGFALGPAMLSVIGTEGWAPFIAAMLLVSLCAAPLLLARDRIPSFSEEPSAKMTGIILTAPTAMAAALIFGAVEAGVFDLFPVYALKNNYTAETAATKSSPTANK